MLQSSAAAGLAQIHFQRAEYDEAKRWAERSIEVAQAIGAIFECTHNVAEGAGAAGVAAMAKERSRIAGRKVAAILSGGNIDRDMLADVLARR